MKSHVQQWINMKVRAKIFTTSNRYVYPEPVLKEAIKSFMEKKDRLVYQGEIDTITPSLSHVAGVVNKIDFAENNDVYAEIEIMQTPDGKVVQKLIEEGLPLKYAPFGHGMVNNGEVIDYTMMGITILPDTTITQTDNEDTTPDDTDAHNR